MDCTPSDAARRTLEALEQGRREGWHLGARVLASLHGTRVMDIAFGERRAGQPMSRDTLLLWLSAGKPITALGIAREIDRGRLHLDQAVADHIPDFAIAGKHAITFRHLLTHTAAMRSAEEIPEGLGWAQTLHALCHASPDPGATPGITAAYQPQATWFLLGEALARLHRRAFAHLIREEILLPLGMTDTWIGMPPAQYRAYGPRLGTTHDAFPPPPRPNPRLDTESACAESRPGSRARGPADDLLRFYEALLQGGRGVVAPDTLAMLVRSHRSNVFDATFRHVMNLGLGFILPVPGPAGATAPYGYGPHASPETFGHSGSQSACAFADPRHGLAVAWICNGLPGEPRHQRRQRALNAAIYEDLGLAAAPGGQSG